MNDMKEVPVSKETTTRLLVQLEVDPDTHDWPKFLNALGDHAAPGTKIAIHVLDYTVDAVKPAR